MARAQTNAEQVVELVVDADGIATIPANTLIPGARVRIVSRREPVRWSDLDREFARRALLRRPRRSKP